jgi:hypothetical protein
MRHYLFSKPEVNRLIEPQSGLNSLASFKVIGRRYDRYVMNRAQRSKIVEGVVSAAERPVTNSSADSNTLLYAICGLLAVSGSPEHSP